MGIGSNLYKGMGVHEYQRNPNPAALPGYGMNGKPNAYIKGVGGSANSRENMIGS